MQKKGKATAEIGGLHEEGYEKIGAGRKMGRGAANRKLWKKEQKEWLDNTLPDPHPCTAGNKEEESTITADREDTQTFNLFYESGSFNHFKFI